MTETDVRLQFLENLLQRNERWITLADAKAGSVMVAIPAILALSGPSIAAYARERLDNLTGLDSNWWMAWSIVYGVILLAMGCVAVVSFWDAVNTVAPRLQYKGVDAEGLIYFQHIAKRTLTTWDEEVSRLDADRMIDEYVRQIHVTASISRDKYQCVSCSIRMAAWFAGLLFLAYVPTLLG